MQTRGLTHVPDTDYASVQDIAPKSVSQTPKSSAVKTRSTLPTDAR